MEERAESLSTGVRASQLPHRRFRPRVEPVGSGDPRPASMFAVMCWFGLAAGLLELTLVVAQQSLIARISLESLRTNRHFLWMIPTADLAIFALVGVVLIRVAHRLPGSTFLLCQRAGAGLLALGALLSVECLHPLAAVILSCAFAFKAGVCLKGRSTALVPWVRATLPWMAAIPVILAGFTAYSEATSERRAWGRLPASPPAASNVLFIVLDNVRADSMSLYGYERPTTPRLAALARTGIRFDSARSPAPWTLPSHASMFTGQWPHRLSVDWMRGLDGTYPTLAEFLAGQGYATAGFVANTYYCNARYGLNRGFARYEDFRENQVVSLFETVRSTSLGKCLLRLMGYSMSFAPGEIDSRKTAAMINRDALDWISSRPDNRPFFLFLNYYDAHSPFIPPQDATTRFGLCALPRQEQIEILKRADHARRVGSAVSGEERAQLDRQTNAIRQDGYESSIAYLDEQIGRLFDELRNRGLLEDTLVIVASDHGEHFQERGFSGHGMSVYRREIHVPLLIFPPRSIADRRVVGEPVSPRELPATIIDLLGLGPSPFPGRSLSRFFRTETSPESLVDPVLSEVGQHMHVTPNPNVPATIGSIRALTTEQEVYIRSSFGREELYDRVADPNETRDRFALEQAPSSAELHREALSRLLQGR